MPLLTILETLLIGPLKLCFEIIFAIANRVIGNPGLAIMVLSLIMNILVLPLYRRADAMQEEARDVEAKLHDGVAHIKKTFSGDERMMILQTYYRQNHYKPTDALNGSVSLLLEVPFFMAAYQFLSHLEILQSASFGPIANLGQPDRLLVIGGLAINVLPILMTLVNVISSAIYLKGFPLKTKIQLYGMAGFFLVFLYNSPSGLVFYWTLNNVFSLLKTIFYKLKNPWKIGGILLSLAGIAAICFSAFFYQSGSFKRRLFLIGIGMILQLPLLYYVLKGKFNTIKREKVYQHNKWVFLSGCAFLTVLMGMLIPSTVIAASPLEFVDPSWYHNPLLYIVSSTCMAAGTFLIWMRVFYWLSNTKGKSIFDKTVWILCGVVLTNYMFFGTDLGVLSADLQFEEKVVFTSAEELVNIAVLAVVTGLMYIVYKKWQRQVTGILLTVIVALGSMSVWNMVQIKRSTDDFKDTMNPAAEAESAHFRLSQDGKNVVVIMLDRALGEVVPFVLNEKPELKEQFAGFTYYSNTISYGGCTKLAAPALFGGYEYTPVEMNRRSEESLAEKHNEALKVMPVLFSENGYEVTVCDPVYAGYTWIPDLSIYNDYPEIKAYITHGDFSDAMLKQETVNIRHRNFFCFSLMKIAPLFAQETIYCRGQYNIGKSVLQSIQVRYGVSKAEGLDGSFIDAYGVMGSLPDMTEITQETTNTYLLMSNDITHEPVLLQAPEYIPLEKVDNTQYDSENAWRFTLDDRTLHVKTDVQMAHYHANMAAFIQLGNWFDYLRANGVYDNTRIILVADHGWHSVMDTSLTFSGWGDYSKAASNYYPLLMVKDFGSTQFTESNAFMTNADVPAMAVDGLISNPVNPFTGVPLTSDEKTNHSQYIIRSEEWDILKNNGNQFMASKWASVREDLRNPDNWKFYDEEIILSEHGGF